MSIALSEFWSRMVQTGLADGDACKQYAAAFAAEHGGASPANVSELLAFLVKSGQLSEFHARALASPEPPAIRFGSFVMTSDQPVRPLIHWMPAKTVFSSHGNAQGDDAKEPDAAGVPACRQGYLLRVPLTGLDETRRAWLAAHTAIKSETLQPIELSGGANAGDAEQVVEIFSPLPTGASLWSVLQQKPKLSPRKTVRIGSDLADALHSMHQASPAMSHGAVGSDHVWVTPKGHAILLRDPSSPARAPLADMSGSWIERIEPTAIHAAPELANPAAVPTIQSDLYSLGCLLFQILTGKPAFEGDDNATLFAAHQGALPAPLARAVADGAAGDPILRVLAFAMAKDPAARFDSVLAFRDALKSAGDLVAGKPQPATDSASHKTITRVQEETAPSQPTTEKDKKAKSPPSDTKATSPSPATPSGRVKPESTEKPTTEERQPTKKPASKKLAAKKTSTPFGMAEMEPNKPVASGATSPAENQSRSQPLSQLPTSETQPETSVDQPQTSKDQPSASSVQPSAAQGLKSEPIAHEPSRSTEPSPTATEPPASRSRKRRKRKRNRLPILGGIMVLPLLMLGLAVALNGRGPQKPKPRPRPQASAIRNVPKVGQARRDVAAPNEPVLVNGYEIVTSDRLLWVPPYSADSPTLSLELLPPGPAGIFSISIANLVGKADARPILRTFGPEIDSLIQTATRRAGVNSEQIQRCTVSLFPGKQGWPETALAIELAEPVPLSVLTEKWGASQSRTPEGSTVYAGDELDADAYYLGDGDQGKLPPDENVKRFAVGSLKRIREIAENGGGTIPLVRNLQTLWDKTSTDSDFVLLMTPNFLFADGREMIAASVPEFRDPLNRWLMPNVSGVSLSANISNQRLYVELRESPSGEATPAILLNRFRESVSNWQGWADNFLLNSKQDPSWLLLATRMPMMFRFVGQQVRSTMDRDTMVASAYLPIDAATQTGLAALLAMNTPRGGMVDQMASETQKSLTVDALLDRKMSISFTQESLQFAVSGVVDEFTASLPAGSTMPPVRIIGGDLEKQGITQNQQIRGFERTDKSLRSVLTDLVLGANPDKTATGPTDPKQSLVWVVHPPDQPASDCEILITTRDAADGKYKLPTEFGDAP